MNIIKMKYFSTVLIAALFLIIGTGCELDINNPNSATEEDVLGNADALRSYTIGMQGFFNESVYPDIVLNTGITTRELAINTTFSSLIELEEGGTALPPANSRLSSIWSGTMRVINMADQIKNSAPELIANETERNGIIAIANIYKAMSLGYLVQCFEQSPIETGEEVAFQSRQQVLSEALLLLQEALDGINSTPLDGSINNVKLSGLDIENTIYALQARYNLFAGNNQAAIDAANEVDMSVTSVFSYDGSTTRNPIFDGVARGDEGQEYAARDNFGTPLTETGDGRLDFFLSSADKISEPNGLPIDDLIGFYTSSGDPIPVYLPGEMNLIKAEAYVNLDEPGLAVDEIDAVRTKQAADDPFGLGANLPAYSGPSDDESLFEEIYRQRSAELYLTGMRFDDARRLGRPVPSDDPPLSAERNRVYYPYPAQERQNNPNTPPDPAI